MKAVPRGRLQNTWSYDRKTVARIQHARESKWLPRDFIAPASSLHQQEPGIWWQLCPGAANQQRNRIFDNNALGIDGRGPAIRRAEV